MTKTALIHDWLNQIGGAEDVLETLVEMFPQAPLYTSLYWREKMPDHWHDWDIRPGFVNRLPFSYRKQQLYFPLYPLNFEHFDLTDYDLVISNKSGFCHGIITEPETVHVCYCLTPTRYLWRYHQYAARENFGQGLQRMLLPFLSFLRVWDRLAADRVDHFVAISEAVRRRIKKFYNRDAVIIYPPVETGRFTPVSPSQVDDYYLFVGRLVPYRRLDLLIEAFNQLKRPLYIAGSGRDRERLEGLADANITFLGYVPDDKLPDLIARCRAFVWPGEEDFGIAPIQAMAAGRPVIAYAAGGAFDTVVPGAGRLFGQQTVADMMAAVESFDTDAVDPDFIRAHAEQFDTAVFKRRLNAFIDQKLEQRRDELAAAGRITPVRSVNPEETTWN